MTDSIQKYTKLPDARVPAGSNVLMIAVHPYDSTADYHMRVTRQGGEVHFWIVEDETQSIRYMMPLSPADCERLGRALLVTADEILQGGGITDADIPDDEAA